jgi:hypothetical protein
MRQKKAQKALKARLKKRRTAKPVTTTASR